MSTKHRMIDGIEYKECSKCKEWKELYEYHKDNSKSDGLHSYCKSCTKEINHNTYIKYPKKKYKKVLEYQIRTGRIKQYKPYNPKYYSAEKSKAKKRANERKRRQLMAEANKTNKLTDEIRKMVFKKYNGKCAYCNTDCTSAYTIDHKIPLCRGGNNAFDNLTISCKYCNSSKGDRTDIEYIGFHV